MYEQVMSPGKAKEVLRVAGTARVKQNLLCNPMSYLVAVEGLAAEMALWFDTQKMA
jgi:hypothetical protein